MTNKIWKLSALGGMVSCVIAAIAFYGMHNYEAMGAAVVAVLAFWLSTSASMKVDAAIANTRAMQAERDEAEDVVDTIWSREGLQNNYAVELEKWLKDMSFDFKTIVRYYTNHSIYPPEEIKGLPDWIGFNHYPYGSELISLYVLLCKDGNYIITVEENEEALIELISPRTITKDTKPDPESDVIVEVEEVLIPKITRELLGRSFLVTSYK